MRESWGFWRHVRETLEQLVSVGGLMLVASTYVTVRVLTLGPEWAVWPAILWQAGTVFNHTGRWIIPPIAEKFLAAKYNSGASAASAPPKPP